MNWARELTAGVTGWGWTALAGCVVSTVGALIVQWRELAVSAAMLAVLLIIAIIWVARPSDVHVELSVSSERVPVGGAAQLLLVVTRRARTPAPKAVDVLIDDERIRIPLPPLGVGARIERRIELDTASRGVRRIGPVQSLRADPFDLVRRERVLSGLTRLVVHPRLTHLPIIASGLVRDLEGAASTELTADDVAFHALREYQPGDDRRLIHWHSSARTGSLLVRQFEPSRRSDVLVAMSTSVLEGSDDDFELAAEVAASIGVDALMERRALRMLVSPRTGQRTRDLDVRTRPRLLDALAAIRRRDELGILDIVRAPGALGDATIAWLVVGGLTSTHTIRRVLSACPPTVTPIVVRCIDGARPEFVQLGGRTIVTVGVLEDLPAALAARGGA